MLCLNLFFFPNELTKLHGFRIIHGWIPTRTAKPYLHKPCISVQWVVGVSLVEEREVKRETRKLLSC